MSESTVGTIRVSVAPPTRRRWYEMAFAAVLLGAVGLNIVHALRIRRSYVPGIDHWTWNIVPVVFLFSPLSPVGSPFETGIETVGTTEANMNSTPPRRRWFQFGIGTMLLLVTVFAVWLAWELSFIRDRQRFLKEVYAGRWDTTHGPSGLVPVAPPASEWAQIPIWRQLLGDKAVDFIVMGDGHTPDECRAARQLFPEALIYRTAKGGPVRIMSESE